MEGLPVSLPDNIEKVCHDSKSSEDDAFLFLDDNLPYTRFVKIYQSLVGSYNWLWQGTHSELAFPTMTLARHAAAPKKEHMTAAKKILCYIYHTHNHCLLFDP